MPRKAFPVRKPRLLVEPSRPYLVDAEQPIERQADVKIFHCGSGSDLLALHH